MNKRGQFYLITAVVIIVAVGGVVIMRNYSRVSEKNLLYEVGEELSKESEYVLDYGVYNKTHFPDLNSLLTHFTELYTRYRGSERDLYFVFGNQTDLTVAGYKGSEGVSEEVLSKISIKPLTGSETYEPLTINGDGDYASKDYEIDASKGIIVVVEDIDYHFNLGSSEYFYFVIMQKIGGEHYIVTEQSG
jgi:hypothetical protein